MAEIERVDYKFSMPKSPVVNSIPTLVLLKISISAV